MSVEKWRLLRSLSTVYLVSAGEIPQGLLHNVYKEQIRGCYDPFVEVIVPLLASASHFCQTRSNAFLKSDVWENAVVDLLAYQLRV